LNIIQTQWENRNENLELWSFPFFQGNKINCVIGFLVSNAWNIFEPNIFKTLSTLPLLALMISEVFHLNQVAQKYIFHAVKTRNPMTICPVEKVFILKSILMVLQEVSLAMQVLIL
jgi:hypothetical protein